MSAQWEKVAPSLDRIRVAGGWLYRTTLCDPSDEYGRPGNPVGVAMVFVPDLPRGHGLEITR
jgi:hypothetical protein